MSQSIKLINIDECYFKIETQFINELWKYDSLDILDKDAHIILVNLLMDYILNRINNSSLTMDLSTTGYDIQIVEDKNRPYILFYYDKEKINLNKEILEYNSIDSFTPFYEHTIWVCNILSNLRILDLNFPFKLFSSIELNNNSKTEKEETLKQEIVTQYYSKTKLKLNKLKEKYETYGIKLTKLQEMKLLK